MGGGGRVPDPPLGRFDNGPGGARRKSGRLQGLSMGGRIVFMFGGVMRPSIGSCIEKGLCGDGGMVGG